MEEVFKDHLVRLPDCFRANQNIKHIIEGIIQMPLRPWQAWGISRKPLPVFDQPHGKEIFPNIQFEPTLAQISAIPLCYTFIGLYESTGFLLLQGLSRSEASFISTKQWLLSIISSCKIVQDLGWKRERAWTNSVGNNFLFAEYTIFGRRVLHHPKH